MISLQNVQKKFRIETVETTALKDISFTIQPGDFIAIVGPSGSGKSTLLNILGFMDKPTSGSYRFGDTEITKLREKDLLVLRQQVSFIFQNFNLIETLSVFENVRIPLLPLSLSRKEQDVRIMVILEKLGIAHRAKHRPYQLSGGQQQRVAIARALVGNPKLLLADEPTGNLDSRNGEEIFGTLKELNEEGVTIAMVTHNPYLAAACKDRLHIQDGQIVDVA